ncbi:hypothetical protein AHF37_00863 [Paragonimus kellicotti]|nr:hypothetical protein AHF37_00863 [Paragonimus kellicotti]
MHHLEIFAKTGLRTLCIASAEVSNAFHANWAEQYYVASTAIDNREEKLEAVAELIEGVFRQCVNYLPNFVDFERIVTNISSTNACLMDLLIYGCDCMRRAQLDSQVQLECKKNRHYNQWLNVHEGQQLGVGHTLLQP